MAIAWVEPINSIRNLAREIVNSTIIYAYQKMRRSGEEILSCVFNIFILLFRVVLLSKAFQL